MVILPVWFVIYLFRPPARAAAAARLASLRTYMLDWLTARPRGSFRFASHAAATMPTATSAIMIVQMALISGFTPSRTSE